MITIENYKTAIRPDILAIDCIPLTPAGHIKMMAFSEGVIAYSLQALKKAIKKDPSMNAISRLRYITVVCNSYCKDNNIRPNWKPSFTLLESVGLTKESAQVDESINLAVVEEVKQSNHEEKKEEKIDRAKNFSDAISFEEKRLPNNKSTNSFWGWLYASQKKKMFLQFPVLAGIYTKDYSFCKDLMVPTILHPDASTNYEHAENVIYSLAEDTKNKIQLGLHGNPWWGVLNASEQSELLTKYPWYAGLVIENPNATAFFTMLAEEIKRKATNEKAEQSGEVQEGDMDAESVSVHNTSVDSASSSNLHEKNSRGKVPATTFNGQARIDDKDSRNAISSNRGDIFSSMSSYDGDLEGMY